eukprot:2587924-Ditylum_brightwellii.AAC.1
MGKYGKICNNGHYKGKGKDGVLGGKHCWFRPGRTARIKTNHLIWYPAYSRSQWVPTCRLYMEIWAWEITDKIQRRSKVTPYVHHLSCGAGGWLWGSEIDPG